MAEQPVQGHGADQGDQALSIMSVVWPALVALLAIALLLTGISLLLSTGTLLTILVLVIGGGLLLLSFLGAQSERHVEAHRLSLVVLGVVTVALVAFVAFLLYRLADRTLAPTLLLAGGGIWLTNLIVFALWYWEVDAGGPRARHLRPYRSVDFVFPQFAADDPDLGKDWRPNLLDYLFLAFTTNTAFSPADTMVLSRRAKLLMMGQATIALIVFGVLLARAVGTV